MRIGICCTPDKLPLISELGYDYMDAHFGWLTGLSDEAFVDVSRQCERYNIPVDATQGFFGATTLFPEGGTPADADALLREIIPYAEKGFARAAALGGKIAVIGSGRQRTIPDGYPRERAEAEFARILACCGEIADRFGMRVAVEPLSSHETNFIHTVADGAAIAHRANHPAVGTMVDFFHLWKNGDNLSSLPIYGDTLIHSHIARANADRNAPLPEDAADIALWADMLSRCPSVRRLTLECLWHPDFDTAVRVAAPLLEPFRKL